MIIQRLFDEPLAQACFLVACGRTREACAIDPPRDASSVLAAASARGLRIVAVTETHIHADFLSGARALAALAGARLYVSDEGGPDWRYAFAGEPGVTRLHDGDAIRVGDVRLDVWHTPGHTPEHVCFLATDEAAGSEPVGMFTGDFVFVGDVGRPDLLERAAGVTGTMERAARDLHRSLARLAGLPDALRLWPGHGAGSACGKSLGSAPETTLGAERRDNWAFRIADEPAFVREVLSGQPEPPAYFAVMKRLNREGPPPLPDRRAPARLAPARVFAALDAGGPVVDLRPIEASARGWLPGSLLVPLTQAFTGRAGALLPYGAPIVLLAPDESAARLAGERLAAIGLDDVEGWAGEETLEAWRAGRGPLASLASLTPRDALARAARGEIAVIDVRGAAEAAVVRVPGALHVPLTLLPGRLEQIPPGRALAVHCGSGARAAIAASVLARAGFGPLFEIAGGIEACASEGLPLERGEAARVD